MKIPTTNFSIETDRYFRNLKYEDTKEVLHFHQYIINNFILNNDKRGLLIYHSMGFGKTILAASITEGFRKLDPTRKSVILLPKSLQDNFRETLKKYIHSTSISNETDESVIANIKEHYKFISSNSSNMFVQIGKVDKTDEEVEFEKNIGLFTDKVSGSLENSVLIIDEFHNLSNSITNGSKNAMKLYNLIMETKNIKLIFLTGTPIINYPFEIVCTMNMLSGKVLFPENIRDFISNFVDKNKNTIKNKSKLQNRITGLVSYYGDAYFEGVKPGFPEELPIKIEHIPMSKEQFAKYLEYREHEIKEESRSFRKGVSDDIKFAEKSEFSTSYRIRSRLVSNFLIPEEAISLKAPNTKSVLKNISLISEDTYKKLDIYSPKYKKILENINKHKGQLQLVFSQFTSAEGLTIFGKVLEANGFKQYDINNNDDIELEINRKGGKRKNKSIDYSDSEDDFIYIGKSNKEDTPIRKFAIYSGDILPSVRDEIIKKFNSSENMHGELIEILLISHQTGGTGLDLKGIRTIHIMEPFWNWALIMQIIGRGIRFKSHEHYPKDEQNVQPYMYLSVFPKSYIAPNDSDESKYTTDMHLYLKSINTLKLNESFLLALIEGSVDCSIHHKKLSKKIQDKIKCHLCAPTDEPLYHNDFYKDLNPNQDDPCKPYAEKKIETQEILMKVPTSDKELKFYYNKDDPKDIKLFEYNEQLEGYSQLKPSHPYYGDLMRKILLAD
jgi:superfamily II DNA or RNA helicase